MESANLPNWLQDGHQKFMQKMEEKHQIFMQWMHSSHEEYMQKMIQQTHVAHTESTTTIRTAITKETNKRDNMPHDANVNKEIGIKEDNSTDMENPEMFLAGKLNTDEEPFSGDLRITILPGAQMGNLNSRCSDAASNDVTSSPSLGGSFTPETGSTPSYSGTESPETGSTPIYSGTESPETGSTPSYSGTESPETGSTPSYSGTPCSDVTSSLSISASSTPDIDSTSSYSGTASNDDTSSPSAGVSSMSQTGSTSSYGGTTSYVVASRPSVGASSMPVTGSTSSYSGITSFGVSLRPSVGASSLPAIGSTSSYIGTAYDGVHSRPSLPASPMPLIGSTSSCSSTALNGITSRLSVGTPSMPAFGSTSSSVGRISPFGQKPLYGVIISPCPTQLNPSRSPFCGIGPTFVSQPFGATSTSAIVSSLTEKFGTTTSTFGAMNVLAYGAPSALVSRASSTPPIGFCSTAGQWNAAFGGTPTPTFGNSPTFGGRSASGQKSSFEGFVSTRPTQSSLSRSTFGQTEPPCGIKSFGSDIQPDFTATSAFTFGSISTQAFDTTATSCAATNDLTFGAPRSPVTKASSAPPCGLCSSPAFGQSDTAFGATSAATFGSNPKFGGIASPFGSQSSTLGNQSMTPTFGSETFGRTPFVRLRGSGSGLASYTSTSDADDGLSGKMHGKIISISAMPQYKGESHEV